MTRDGWRREECTDLRDTHVFLPARLTAVFILGLKTLLISAVRVKDNGFGVWPLCMVVQWWYMVGSGQRLATGRAVRESNPDGGEIFQTRPARSWGPPSLLYDGYRVIPGAKVAEAGR